MLRRLTVQFILLCLAIGVSLGSTAAEGRKGYYRFPAIHGKTIAFVAEGDIWTVAVDGGVAHRLTSHPGDESHPRISPDGRLIAFAAEYEGPTEVYTMPLDGGPPVRRTFSADPSVPAAWTPDGKLVYTTRHFSTLPDLQLVSIDLASQQSRRIPLSQASEAAIDRDGTIYFVRPAFHQQAVKRYQGGTARKIWRFASKDNEAKNLTADHPGESHSPMWEKGRLYFVTDRDGTMNIWSMNDKGGDLKQHTRHSGWDVQSTDLHEGRIVYQLGADLWLYDIASGVDRNLPITLASDFDQLREKWVERPLQHLTSVHLHPSGGSIVLTARGQVFVVPVKDGRFVRASRKNGVRYRDACFLPNGSELLALSDESGEFEFCKLSARGMGEATRITSDARILRGRGYPSPDGKHFASVDKNRDLWVTELATGKGKTISAHREGSGDIVWSPDSRWLVFSETAENTYRQLKLYNLESGSTTTLTSDRVNSFGPAWSPDGHWLYFLSDRSLRSLVAAPWGPRQPEPYFDKSVGIYRLALQSGLRSPFQPVDELHPATFTGILRRPSGTAPVTSPISRNRPVHIDLEGIQKRVKSVFVPAGDLSGLSVNSRALFWIERPSGRGSRGRLMALEIGNQGKKPQQLLPDVRSYELSSNGQKILVRSENDFFVFDAAPSAPMRLSEDKVDLSAWHYSIDVQEDLREMFVDAWRLHRDYFYDPSMHGVDWKAMRAKYESLVGRVTTRSELNDLLAQMVGELSVLHSAVRGGERRQGPDHVSLASLGARLERDEKQKGYRIDYIYRSDPDYPGELSPLADPDLDIKEGDLVEAINGEPVLSQADPALFLRHQSGRQVLLRIRSARDKKSRELIVTPIADEASLRYRDWEYTRRQRVEHDGKGKIGYVHLRAMTGDDLSEWYRSFYPVFGRQGLIVDVRHNRGGNIDSIILEKLMRKAWFYWKGRVGDPYWNMQYAFRGHLVVLCDEHTASDGEAFTEGFRRLGLGKVIGTRTWGGEIWLTSSNLLSDGGVATAAEFGVYGPERKWLIEGHGVDPDTVVDNLPHATFNGGDAQLDAAIKHLQEAMSKDPRPVPEPPKYPDKSLHRPERPLADIK